MNDAILCPYCPDGIPMEISIGGMNMRCPRCSSTSPMIRDLHTAAITPEDIVRAAARRRYVRRAEWMFAVGFENESARDNFDITCSACGVLIGNVEDRATAEDLFEMSYCPGCGAEMYRAAQHDEE